MIDIHNHLLYGIDDGSRNISESVEVIKTMFDNGITDIILTPHYIHNDTYSINNKRKFIELEALRKRLKKENVNVNLYLGNEVTIDNKILENINNDNIYPLNGTKYILVEFKMYSREKNDKDILFDLIDNGYIPVLAHPERYLYYFKDFTYFEELLDRGVLLQCNLKSLLGFYGREAKIMVIELLKRNMVHFMANDTHRNDLDYIKEAKKRLVQLVGIDKAAQLLYDNARQIIV